MAISKSNKYDVVIVGAGPAGIFTAMEMLKKAAKRVFCCWKKAVPLKNAAAPKAKPRNVFIASPATLQRVFRERELSLTASFL